jgi:hypothetical protein
MRRTSQLAFFPYQRLLVNIRLTQRGRPPPIQPWCSILDTKKHHRSRSGCSRRRTQHGPPATQSTHIDDALCDALVRLDDARTGQPWARNAGRASALLALFDSESRVLRVSKTGPCPTLLGRRVSGANYECMELVGPGSPRYLELEPARTRWMDAEEPVNEGVIPSPGPLDASSVKTRSVEVRDGDYLVLGSESAWAGLEGRVAMQAVSA